MTRNDFTVIAHKACGHYQAVLNEEVPETLNVPFTYLSEGLIHIPNSYCYGCTFKKFYAEQKSLPDKR